MEKDMGGERIDMRRELAYEGKRAKVEYRNDRVVGAIVKTKGAYGTKITYRVVGDVRKRVEKGTLLVGLEVGWVEELRRPLDKAVPCMG